MRVCVLAQDPLKRGSITQLAYQLLAHTRVTKALAHQCQDTPVSPDQITVKIADLGVEEASKTTSVAYLTHCISDTIHIESSIDYPRKSIAQSNNKSTAHSIVVRSESRDYPCFTA